MRTVIQIILAIAILVLAYFVYESIQTPIRFNKAKDIRERAAINRLIDIREAQKAYKDVKLEYTASFDTLINFLRTDSFEITKAIGTIPEDLIDELGSLTKAREEALKRGLIRRETTKVSVMDSLFGRNFAVDSLRYVPFTDGVTFDMQAGEFETPSNLKVKVVEVSVLYKDLLKGLDPQLVVNYSYEREKITKFPGLKLGSMTEGTLTGNWE
jgi:hypothetical protein